MLAVAAAVLAILVGTVVTGAQAATLFTDGFEDGNDSGWTKSGGSWSVVVDGTRVYRQASLSSDARALAGSSAWTDTAVQARVKPLGFNGSDRFAALLTRAQGATSYYYLAIRSSQRVELKKLVGGSSTTLATAPLGVATGTWYTLRLEAVGGSLRAFVNGTLVGQATDSTFRGGRVGVATFNASAVFDDVSVETAVATPTTTSPTTTTIPGPTTTTTPPQPPTGIFGFATVNAWGQNGTTGGSGGPTVTATTPAQFLDFIARPGPLVIRVQGMLALPGPMHDVTSDKTILGVGSNSGITGAGLNIGLPIDDEVTSPPANAVHNIIIRNMVFRDAADDSINVQMFSHHIWIDHNDLAEGFDGLIDIKRGSSYITVSWNHTHDHSKNMLLGRDDGDAAQDSGRLKVTYHHNWFDETPQRNPRVRFGEPVHVLNNYYFHNTDVGVACQASSGCMVEGNYFEDVEEPMTIHYAGPTGRIVQRNNVFVGETGAPDVGGSVEEPRNYYSYPVDNPADVKAIVTAGAGVGKIGL